MIPLLKDKSYSFAVEIVRLVQYLQQEKKEYVLSKQILKSGTSIGALIHEAVFAQSDSDYLNKLAVSLKEANETLYWLNLLRDTDYIHIDLYEKLAEYIKINHLESDVILTGALTGESLYAWYYLAHIFILPSSFEPFGAVVNEALVAGCQTIVSNKVGASCLINKKNGKIFDIEKDDQLKNAISELLSRVPIEKVHQSLMAKTFNSFFNDLTDFMSI